MDINLNNYIDIHIHSAPDVQERTVNDIEAASEAREAGMKAILLKGKHCPTYARARLVEGIVSGIRVFGSLCLDRTVGGLNPFAVESSIQMGAKEVYMPTYSAKNHIKFYEKRSEGITILDNQDRLLPEVYEIIDLIAAADIILGTGHISVQESIKLVNAASQRGVKKIAITHPELPAVDMGIDIQKMLRNKAFFERHYVSTLPAGGNVPFARIVNEIRQVGVEKTVIATDFGVAGIPHPVEGMRMYVSELIKSGFKTDELVVMGKINPQTLLGI